MCKTIGHICLLLLLSLPSLAQVSDQTTQWFHTFGGESIDKITCIETDSAGNSYVLGSFMNEVNFGDESTPFELVSDQHFSVFLTKLSPQGELLWVHKVEQLVWGQGAGMAIDSDGNIILTGSFFGTPFSIDSSAKSTQQKTSCFVEKVSPHGTSIWSFGLYTEGSAFGQAVTTDSKNNIFIGGGFTGLTDFETGANTETRISNGGNDAFVLKLDENAAFQWVYSFGNHGEEATYSLTLDKAERVYAVGSCGMNLAISEHYGDVDGFIHQLSLEGERNWTQTLGGPGFDLINDIAFDAKYNLIVCGVFQKEMRLENHLGETILLTDEDHRNKWVTCTDGFVAKYSSNRELLWAKQFGGVNNDQFLDIEVDDADNLIVAGSFERFASLENEPLLLDRLGVKSHGRKDGVVIRYDLDGNMNWIYSLGSRENDVMNAISIETNGRICMGGYYGGKLNFAAGNGLFNRAGYRIPKYLDCFIQTILPPPTFHWDISRIPVAIEEKNAFSVQQDVLQLGITVYPNPTANSIFLEFPVSAESIEIRVVDQNGNTVIRMDSSGETNLQLSMSGLANGTYIMNIMLDKVSYSERFVIAR